MVEKKYIQALLLCLLAWSATAAYQLHNTGNRPSKSGKGFGSSVFFPVTGNVYPNGYYSATVNVGQPPKPYFLDIDTGSDLTWLQCDAPCTKCIPSPHSPYKPNRNLIACKHALCVTLQGHDSNNCDSPDDQCDYEVNYADLGSSLGVLVIDSFPFKFTNGSRLGPRLVFGCGYNQEVPSSVKPPFTDGVLGLGNGKSSIVAQLSDMGLTRNVVGHCLSGQGGGFLFFGDEFLPTSGIVWTPMLSQAFDVVKYYSLGPADLHFGGRATNIQDLSTVFDSGSTYNYFSSQAYNALVSMINKDINGKLTAAVDDKNLPVCWKGSKRFKSIRDVTNFFKPIVLSFRNGRNVQFQMLPQAYLIVTEHGNVCLGILDGGEVGLGNLNVIGDISLQDKLVIYDNEKKQIGWAAANCDRLPNMDRGFVDGDYRSRAADFGIIFQDTCPAKFGSGKRKQDSV